MRLREAMKLVVGTMPFLAFPFLAFAAELPPELAADRLVVRAERQVREGEHRAALASLDEAQALFAEHGLEAPPDFWFRHAQVAREAGEMARAMESATRYAAAAGREGEHYLAALEILDASERELEAQRQREALERAQRERDEAAEAKANAAALEALEAVRRGEPLEMVTIPAGRYRMGCVSGRDCYDDEKPVHRVHIEQSFAISKYEVTFAQWDACVLGVGCGGYRPDDEGWGRGNQPVVNISWDDAQLYVKWLSDQTGSEYRLPTEAEWEYAARAGTTTQYSWGNDIGENLANCGGCGSQWDSDRSAPVGSFPANAFGLHDMHGNVAEWVLDCWNGSYRGAPGDGSAWISGNCSRRVARGGSWIHDSRYLRSADRIRGAPGGRGTISGFRVARTLTP